MPLATQYEFMQTSAHHVVEVGGQVLVAVKYDVAANTITLPSRGRVTVPIATAIAANVTLETFCAKVLELYKPSMVSLPDLEIEMEYEDGAFEVEISVGDDTLTDLTASPTGLVTAEPRSVGPIPFPGFYWALRAVTRTLRYIEAVINKDTVRQLTYA